MQRSCAHMTHFKRRTINLTLIASLFQSQTTPIVPHTTKLLLHGSTLYFLGTPDRLENHSHMPRPPISPDHVSIPPPHLLPSSPIPPHSLSHSANATPNNLLSLCHSHPAPIYSPPRTTTPTTPLFLDILPESDKGNSFQFFQV